MQTRNHHARFRYLALVALTLVIAACAGTAATTTTGADTGTTGTTGTTAAGQEATTTIAGDGIVRGGTLRVAGSRSQEQLNPWINTGITFPLFQGHVYETLAAWNVSGELEGRLAESWENPDPLTWIFHLRQGVTFHNGNPFTSEDVLYTIEKITEEGSTATRRVELGIIASVEAPDDFTVVFTTSEPDSTLPIKLSAIDVSIVDKEWVEAGGDFSTEMMGTGPFMLGEYEVGVQYTLLKNESYWQDGIPYLDSVEIIPIPDETARVNALKSGEVDFAELLSWQTIRELENDPQYGLTTTTDSFVFIRFNATKPPFDDPRVRQAVNYAIDRDVVSELAFGGLAVPMKVGLVNPASTWYNADLETWSYDPDKAMALLAEAGLEPGDISFDYLYTGQVSLHVDMAQVVVRQLQEFGFNVTDAPIDTVLLVENRGTGDYQVQQDGGSTQHSDPSFYGQWFETGAGSFAGPAGFTNSDLDALLAEARTTDDEATRKDLYRQVEEILLAEAPIGFGVFRPQAEGYTADVMGYTRTPGFGSDSPLYMKFDTVWLDR